MDKGLKILMAAYWDCNGWKTGEVSDEDYEIAKSEGYMFPFPEKITHDETLHRLKEVCSSITPKQVADAFLYSLSTRQLQYRSALATYWYAMAIPEHSFLNYDYCGYCNWYPWYDFGKHKMLNGTSVLNFERYKWGGVRHTQPQYALFDLEQFKLMPKVTPTKEDRIIFSEILNCIYELEASNKAGKLRDLILKKKIMKTNKQEITTLLEILSICGVLSSERIPCYNDCFEVDTTPVEHTNDMTYPLNRWKASDGINENRYKIVFGEKHQNSGTISNSIR